MAHWHCNSSGWPSHFYVSSALFRLLVTGIVFFIKRIGPCAFYAFPSTCYMHKTVFNPILMVIKMIIIIKLLLLLLHAHDTRVFWFPVTVLVIPAIFLLLFIFSILLSIINLCSQLCFYISSTSSQIKNDFSFSGSFSLCSHRSL
jgi:hypothetical protein